MTVEANETVFCTACGARASLSDRFCRVCGASMQAAAAVPVVWSTLRCPFCAEEIPAAARKCRFCGEFLDPALSVGGARNASTAGLSIYYDDEFSKINASGESYKGRWNWAAFFFGALWALSKGLWLPALICFVGSIFTYGVVGIVYWFIFGARGNYMYYCKLARRRDIAF